jgi:hypothetical protein
MKTEKQLTAVEWLCNEWLYLDQQFDMCLIDRNIYWDKLRQIQEQAKEMEKEQIMNAFDECGMWQDNYSDSEHYYNKTFKSE